MPGASSVPAPPGDAPAAGQTREVLPGSVPRIQPRSDPARTPARQRVRASEGRGCSTRAISLRRELKLLSGGEGRQPPTRGQRETVLPEFPGTFPASRELPLPHWFGQHEGALARRPSRLAGHRRGLLSWAPVDDLSKLTPLRRGDGAAPAPPSRPPAREAAGRVPRQPEAPWRLAVVEAWFARARQAGLDTIALRRRARLAREGSVPLPKS